MRLLFTTIALASVAVATVAQVTPTATGSNPSSTSVVSNDPNKTPNCGSQFGGVGCADSSHCCSSFGFCGVGEDSTTGVEYCGTGCQGGPCDSGSIQLKPAPASNTTSAVPATNSTTAATQTPNATLSTPTARPRTTSTATSTPTSASDSAAGNLGVPAIALFAGALTAGTLKF